MGRHATLIFLAVTTLMYSGCARLRATAWDGRTVDRRSNETGDDSNAQQGDEANAVRAANTTTTGDHGTVTNMTMSVAGTGWVAAVVMVVGWWWSRRRSREALDRIILYIEKRKHDPAVASVARQIGHHHDMVERLIRSRVRAITDPPKPGISANGD